MCAGAYVAKPRIPLVYPEGPPMVDDVPPGWNLNWPFPGPYPPGYAPELTFPMTATAVIAYDGAAETTGEFRDHDDFITNEPDAVILTAVIASSPSRSINLRFSGDTEYASSISIDCTLADYWGVRGDIEFELTRADEGGTITLTGTGAVKGVIVTETVEITVYQPAYSLVMSGTAGMTYDETASITASLRDHVTLGTDEPAGSTLTWTATIDGVAVGLRFSGDPAYSSSISSAYSDIGDYWGAEKDIEFDLTEENDEDTVVLRVESTVFGEDLATTHDIVIGAPYGIVTLTMTGFQGLGPMHRNDDPELAGLGNTFGASLHFGSDTMVHATPYARVYHYFKNRCDDEVEGPPFEDPWPRWNFTHGASPETPDEFEIRAPVADGQVLEPLVNMVDGDGVPYPQDWLIGECNGNQIAIKAVRFKPYWVLPWVPLTYSIQYSIWRNFSGSDVTLDFTFTMYSAGGDAIDTWTKQVTVEPRGGNMDWVPKIEWLTIDGATREVTVINP